MLSRFKYIGLSALIALTSGLTPPAADNGRAIDDSNHAYLALGDSYTIGESVPGSDRYPEQAVRLVRDAHVDCADPEIIATTGWTTADLLEGIYRKATPQPPYELVTLLIGVNNEYQGRSLEEYRQQFTMLLQQSILLAGHRPSHVIVLSIPDYSVTPFAHGGNTSQIASRIDAFNAINFQLSTDYKVNYVDVTGESRKAATDLSLIASDGLHFSGKEYGIWASLLEPVMKGVLK
jgi:lysophospholipase L1-like esterase